MTSPARWVHEVEVEATLRDTDALGHVNNAVYLTWFEAVRTRYVYARRGLTRADELDFILASTTIDFRSPVLLHERIAMRCAPVRIGRSSWELAYEGRSRADGRLVVDGRSVQVQYDYTSRKPVPIPEAWRRLLDDDLPRS